MRILYSSVLFTLADGHGFMASPRSRNWISTPGQDGVNTPASGKPTAEYCEHCLNVNDPTAGSCSATSYNDYNNWLDSTGSPMPFTPQEVYTEGDIITVSSFMATHHNGHIEMRYCDLNASGGIFTPDCFDGNYLSFVEDVGVYNTEGVLMDPADGTENWLKMPPDGSYPERGYLSAGQSAGTGYYYTMTFKLPMGLSGDQIMLQWKYITANSCSPYGYNEYFSDLSTSYQSYWNSGLSAICTRSCYEDGTCISAFNEDGERGTQMPEQFFNCAEVSILPSDGTGTTTSATTTSSSSGSTTSTATSTTTAATGVGCCTIDFKSCSPTVTGWCSESESNCINECNKWWLPNGAVTGCTARYESCSTDSDCCSPGVCLGGTCQEPSTSSSSTTSSTSNNDASTTTTATAVPSNYCSWYNGEYTQPGNDYCHSSQSNCEGNCSGVWITATTSTTASTSVTESSTTTGTTSTTASTSVTESSTTPGTSSTTTNAPDVSSVMKCSDDAQVLSTVDALYEMDDITYVVSSDPKTLAVIASGGAAGAGGDVVSESQAYGLLSAALALADVDSNDPLYEDVMEKFWGYYNGWKIMCQNSAGPCQATEGECNGSPCLPGWKHSGDFSTEIGTGAAPDGDVDAIVGMIIGVKALEGINLSQEWQIRVDEIKDWADKSCTSFMTYNTVLSSSGNHRLLKLGSCWGGWDSNGNNPSYHAPGHYRMMRDFQASVNSGNQPSSDDWNMLIDTSYKFLNVAQCPSGTGSGLVPNWALVQESADGESLETRSGSFSGSGTPQYEFGSEASRTMWRVAFDALAYPEESATQAIPFLDPLNTKLAEGFDPNPLNGYEFFSDDSLQICSPTVTAVFGAWQWNGFIFGPVLSTLAAYDNQDMIDKACSKVGNIDQETYYSRSWMVLASMMLNGAVARSGQIVRGVNSPVTSTTSTVTTTSTTTTTTELTTTTASSTTTTGTNVSTTNAPETTTASTTTTSSFVIPESYCDWGNGYEQPTNGYCHSNKAQCEGSCHGSWVVTAGPTCFPIASKVKINSITGLPLHMFDVQIISLGSNIAQGKVAEQSSTLADHDASLALDTDPSTFSHTNDSNPFFEVDLGESYPIESIVIANRFCTDQSDEDGCLCHLSHAAVSISDELGKWVAAQFIGDTCGQLEVAVAFQC